ncbi:MAG: hypothetical protein GYB67_02045, partial [Chloroflexi bacterium]|nr:hypothetical protein [Chloroflexota bacterium]
MVGEAVSALLSLLGPVAIAVTLVVLGRLSRRLGAASQAKPYYGGFYVGAALLGLAVGVRLLNLVLG